VSRPNSGNAASLAHIDEENSMSCCNQSACGFHWVSAVLVHRMQTFYSDAAKLNPGLETLPVRFATLVSDRVVSFTCRLQLWFCGGPENRRFGCPARRFTRSLLELAISHPKVHVGDRLTIEGRKMFARCIEVTFIINTPRGDQYESPSFPQRVRKYFFAGRATRRLAWF